MFVNEAELHKCKPRSWPQLGGCRLQSPEGAGEWRYPNTHTRLGFQRCPSVPGRGHAGLGCPGNRSARSCGNQHYPRARSRRHAHAGHPSGARRQAHPRTRYPPGPRSRGRARATDTRRDYGRSRSTHHLGNRSAKASQPALVGRPSCSLPFPGPTHPYPPEVRPSGQEGKRAWER